MKISDAEWRVMRIVWQLQRATAGEVIEALAAETDWNHRTIRTLLRRLVEKGALQTQQEGNRYVYQPSVSQDRCVLEETRSFLDKVFDGDAAELLVHFVQNEEISSQQIAELKKLLDQKSTEVDG